MKAEKRIPILMKRKVMGSIDKVHPMTFEAGKVYMTNLSMAWQFIDMNAAAISVIPEAGAYHMHVLPGAGPTWVLLPA